MIGLQTGFFDRPVTAGKFTLRGYQTAGIEAITREHAKVRSTALIWCTSAGKTVAFCEVGKQHGGCLVVCDRDRLIRQAADKLSLATGVPIAIEKAQEKAWFGSKYIVASVQTLRGERLKRFALRFPDIPVIIFDEGDQGVSPTWRAVADAWPKAKLLYVTATPDRTDGVGLRTIVDSVAHEFNVIDATNEGYVAPFKFIPIRSEVDLDKLKVKKQNGEKDFDPTELDNAVSAEAGKLAVAVLAALDENGPTSRFIAFCPGVKTSHACADAVNELRPGTAGVVDGSMDADEKDPVMAAHEKGEIRVVFNCNILTAGHDDPTLTGVFLLRPTGSRRMFSQQCGRAGRLWPGVIEGIESAEERKAAIAASPKPFALVYDLVANSALLGGRHDIIFDGVDLLAGKDLPEKTRAEAKKILREKGGTVADAVKEARDKLRAMAAARRIAAATKITVGTPRTIFDRTGVNFAVKQRGNLPMRPEDHATEAMKWRLREDGIPVPPRCSKVAFQRLLKSNRERKNKGLCQLGGVEFLRKYGGIDAWSLTSEQAKRVAYAIAENGYKPLDPSKLGEAIERTPGEDDE